MFSLGGKSMVSLFPRVKTRGSIEAPEKEEEIKLGILFPRVKTRGSIEALQPPFQF